MHGYGTAEPVAIRLTCQLGRLSTVSPAIGGLGEDVCGPVRWGGLLGRPHHDRVFVYSHGTSKLVVGHGVGGGELGRLSHVGPAGGGLGEDVCSAGITLVIHTVVGIDVVLLVRTNHDGVAVHGDGMPEAGIIPANCSGELAHLGPAAGNLGEYVGRTGIVGFVGPEGPNHQGVAVHGDRPTELVIVIAVV